MRGVSTNAKPVETLLQLAEQPNAMIFDSHTSGKRVDAKRRKDSKTPLVVDTLEHLLAPPRDTRPRIRLCSSRVYGSYIEEDA